MSGHSPESSRQKPCNPIREKSWHLSSARWWANPEKIGQTVAGVLRLLMKGLSCAPNPACLPIAAHSSLHPAIYRPKILQKLALPARHTPQNPSLHRKIFALSGIAANCRYNTSSRREQCSISCKSRCKTAVGRSPLSGFARCLPPPHAAGPAIVYWKLQTHHKNRTAGVKGSPSSARSYRRALPFRNFPTAAAAT